MFTRISQVVCFTVRRVLNTCVCPVLTPRPTVGRAAQASPPLPFLCCLLDTYVCTLYIICTFTCLKVCGSSIKKIIKKYPCRAEPCSQERYWKLCYNSEFHVLLRSSGNLMIVVIRETQSCNKASNLSLVFTRISCFPAHVSRWSGKQNLS